MFSTRCGGLWRAGGDGLLLLWHAAAAGVPLGEEERPRSMPGPGRAGVKPRSLEEETRPAPQGEGSRTAHLCCSKRVSCLPRLPEPARAGEKPAVAAGTGTESCSHQLPGHRPSTEPKASAPHSKPRPNAQLEHSRTSRLGEAGCPNISTEGRDVTRHGREMSQGMAGGCPNAWRRDATMARPRLQRSPQQPCSPSTRLGAYGNVTARSIPHIFWRVFSIAASNQPPGPWQWLHSGSGKHRYGK